VVADTSLTFTVIGRDLRATSTLRDVGREARQTERALNRMGASSIVTNQGLRALTVTALGLGPALVPIAAAAAVGIGGLTSALVTAGSAAGVFGLAAFGVGARLKDIIESGEAVPKVFRPAVDAFKAMSSAWQTFLDNSQPATLGIFATGMNIVATMLGKIGPLFDVAASAAGRFLEKIRGFVEGGGFDTWIAFLAANAGPVLDSFGQIMINLAKIIGNLVVAFAPLTGPVLGAIERFTAGLANATATMGESSGFQQFLAYVRDQGPLVASTLSSMGAALWNLIRAGAIIGPIVLQVVKAVSDLIAAMDPHTLAQIAGAIIAIVVAFQALKVVMSIASILSAIGPWGALALAIIAVGAGLYILATRTEEGRKALERVGSFITDTLWPALQRLGDEVLSILVTGFNNIKTAVEEFWAVAGPIVQQIVDEIVTHWPEIKQTAIDVWTTVKSIVSGAMEFIAIVIRGATTVISFIWSHFGETIVQFIAQAFDAVLMIIRGALQMIRGVIDVFLGVLTGDWSRAWHGLGDIVGGALKIVDGLLRAAGAVILAIIRGMINTASAVFSGGWNRIVAFARAAFGGLVGAAAQGLQRLVSTMRTWLGIAVSVAATLPQRIVRALGNLGSLLYGAGKAIIQGMINGIRAMAGSLLSAAKRVVSSAINAAKRLLHIGSPSKVFIEIGAEVGAGFVNGLRDAENRVRAASARMADAAIFGAQGAVSSGALTGTGARAAGGAASVVEVRLSAEEVMTALMTGLRKQIRVNGGNVQTALGLA